LAIVVVVVASQKGGWTLTCTSMSVLFETSLGDLVIDLQVESCPKTCENFLKLCKVYYYNLNAFFNGTPRPISCTLSSNTARPVSKDFLAQAGDPTATGTGGESIWSYVSHSPSERYFPPEFHTALKHRTRGTVSMAVAPTIAGQPVGGCGSQFFITLGENIDYLDGKHAVFGQVVEGMETLDKINEVFTDQGGRPFKDIRIRHVVILGASVPLISTLVESDLYGRRPIPRPSRTHSAPLVSHAPARQFNPHRRGRRPFVYTARGGSRA
jgi:peptidyl-prolyl cis-trans isomerase-like 4